MPRPLFSHLLNLRQPSGGGKGVVSQQTATVTTGLSFNTVETTICTLPAITTLGGTIQILGLYAATVAGNGGTPSAAVVTVRIYRDGVLQRAIQPALGSVATTTSSTLPGITFAETPPAGSHVYHVSVQAATANILITTPAVNAGAFWVMELGAGMQGATGPAGAAGSAGAPGAPGTPGAQGLAGPMGFPGDDGDEGMIGPPGLAGAAGAQGPPGIAGLIGPPGMDGDSGGGSDDIAMLGLPTGGDPFGQYLYLPGRAGGQTAAGGTLVSQSLTLNANSSATVPHTGFVRLDDPQLWWPTMPSYTANVTSLRRVMRFNPAFTTSPDATHTHTLLGFVFDPGITSVSTAVVTANVVMHPIQITPTATIGPQVDFAGVFAGGTFTATALPALGTWKLFTAEPTLTSTTATIPPYPPVVFRSRPTITYNSSGTAALGLIKEFEATAEVNNLSSGTFQVDQWDQIALAPQANQSAGTTQITILRNIHMFAPSTVTGCTVDTQVGIDIENLSISQTTTPVSIRTATTSVASGTARAFQDIGGALSQYVGMAAYAYAPTSQTIPTGYYVQFATRQQWVGVERLTLQGTARLRGN
jgi:hypothetical protein